MNEIELELRQKAKSIFLGDISSEPPKPIEPKEVALFYWMLFKMRDYTIKKIKDPIRKALEKGESFARVLKIVKRSVARLPRVEENRLQSPNARILLQKRDKLLSYHHNSKRAKMLEAGLTMVVAEIEHDAYYAFLGDWLLIEMAMEIAKGTWRPSVLEFPYPSCWSGGNLPDIDEIRQRMKEYLGGFNERANSFNND